MSDTGNAAAPAASDGNAVAETPAAVTGDGAAAATTPLADTTATEPSWRERYAGADKAALKDIERYATERDFFKGFRDTKNKLRTEPRATLPEGATEEEVAAHRKALGIPEKPEEYGLAFPETFQADERATQMLGSFAQIAHELNLRPDQAKALLEWNVRTGGELDQHRAAAASEATLENIADLRNEFKGREYTRNMALATEYLDRHFEGYEEALQKVLHTRLDNGVEIRNFAPFVKGLVRAARETASEEALIAGDAGSGGRSAQEEYQALVKESVLNRREFDRSGKRARLEQLAGLIAKQQQAA